VATSTIGGTVATFSARIAGSQDEAGDLEQITFATHVASAAEWADLVSLVTTKYHVHVPLDPTADPIIDIVRGPGEGTLVVAGFGSASAILVAARQSAFVRSAAAAGGTAVFLLTSAWTP